MQDYDRELEGKSPDEAAQRISTLELKVSQLEANKPRSLTAAQRSKFIELAGMDGRLELPIEITHDATCADCNHFASEIADALRHSGNWNISEAVVIGPRQKSYCGFAVLGSKKVLQSKDFQTITRPLGASSIEFQVIQEDNHSLLRSHITKELNS